MTISLTPELVRAQWRLVRQWSDQVKNEGALRQLRSRYGRRDGWVKDYAIYQDPSTGTLIQIDRFYNLSSHHEHDVKFKLCGVRRRRKK